jgi:hypothetical protein
MTPRENPAPRAKAGNRADRKSPNKVSDSANPVASPDIMTAYLANSFHLPLPIAALVNRLAKPAEVLS